MALISVYYTSRSVSAFESSDKLTEESDASAFMDFEMMLMSVLPHKYFALYLQQEKPQLQPYLQMIHIVRLYSEEGQVLAEKEEQLEKEQRNQANKRTLSMGSQTTTASR